MQGRSPGAYSAQAAIGSLNSIAGSASPSKSKRVRLSFGLPSPGRQPTPGSQSRRVLGEEILVLGEWQLGLDPATGAEGRYCGARVSRPAGSYRTYVDTHRAFLDSITGIFVRCAMSDFDERPRYPIQITDPERVRWYADQTPQLFARSVGIVADDIAVSTRPPVVDNFVQIDAWNEWHEGGITEPNVKDGCTYLDIIQRELALEGRGCRVPPPVSEMTPRRSRLAGAGQR